MSLKEAAFRFWKPAVFAGATVTGVLGARRWGEARRLEEESKNTKRTKQQKRDELGHLFDRLDWKGSGFIGQEELRSWLNMEGEKEKINFTPSDVQAMISSIDLHHDGKLSKDEFVSMMTNDLSISPGKEGSLDVASMTKVNESHLQQRYGAPPHQHKHPMTPAQIHDEIKRSTDVEKENRKS